MYLNPNSEKLYYTSLYTGLFLFLNLLWIKELMFIGIRLRIANFLILFFVVALFLWVGCVGLSCMRLSFKKYRSINTFLLNVYWAFMLYFVITYQLGR